MSDPRTVRRGVVLKAGRPAATLTRHDSGVQFAYLPDYLASPGPAVATTLPLTDEPLLTVGGAVPAFFAGLLPEGRRLTALRRAVKTSADDELSLLLAVGDDPVGDVQVLPEGAIPEQPQPAALTGSFADLDFAELAADIGIDPSALAGVQEKASGRLLTIPLLHDGRAHLLKLTPPEYPHLVENEAYFLDVARRLRQRVVQAEVVHDRAGRAGLLVTRFDRVAAGMALHRLAVEDAGQLLGRYPADKYAVTTEAVIGVVSRLCAASIPAAHAVLQQVALAWVTGNGDLHAKNVSVLATAPGAAEWRVAPIYDVPSTVPYGDHTMALPVSGRRDGWSRPRLVALGIAAGLPESAAESAIDEVLTVTATLADDLDVARSPFDATRTRRLTRALRARHRALHP